MSQQNGINKDGYSLWSVGFENNAPDIWQEGEVVENVFNTAEEKIGDSINDIVNIIVASSPAITEIMKGMNKEQNLQLVFSPEVTKKLKEGTLELLKKTTNGVKAVAVDPKTHKIVEIGSVDFSDVMKGVSPDQLMFAVQSAQLQREMKELSKELQDVSFKLDQTRKGLHTDRLAKYYSAENLYMEACSVKREGLKNDLEIQCLTRLNDAIAEMGLSLKNDIEEFDQVYKQNKGRQNKRTTEIINEINELFEVIHKAYVLETAIFYNMGETDSMGMSLVQYKIFLRNITSQKDIMDNIYRLDNSVKVLDDRWSVRADKMSQKIVGFLDSIENPQEYKLEIAMEVIYDEY